MNESNLKEEILEICHELEGLDNDLDFFQEIAEEVPKTFALLEKEDERKIPEDDDKLREFKKNNEQLKNFIQQERKKRGLATPTNKPTNNQPNPPQNSQQVQNLQKEINDLNQKVAELQNQIKELLAKQEKEPLDQNTKQEIQQKQQPTNTSQPKNEFNWLYVVIPGAVLLVVMGIIIAYLLAKIKPEKQNQYGRISTEVLTNFCDSLEATLDGSNSHHLFPKFDKNKSFEELFPPTGGKSSQEFINHLKTLYENCPVYFDIQEKIIVIKNQRTKAEREEEVKYADEFKRMRIRYQELRSMGRTDLPEFPTSTEECYSDKAYQPEETQEKLAKEAYNEAFRENFVDLIKQFHEAREQYEALSEEEKEFYNKRDELHQQLEEKQFKLVNYQIRIQELIDNPDEKAQKLVSLSLELIEIVEKEIKEISRKLEMLESEQKIRQLRKEIEEIKLSEVFKESDASISETKHIQTEKFALVLSRDGTQQINYLVIDTAGFGDTKLSEKEVLQLLKDLVPIIKENGINQIFLVNNGRFKKEEIDIYKILENVLFDENAGKFTTIVRTKFSRFGDQEACEEDERKLRTENNEIAEILQTSKLIHVDNPPLEGRPRVIEVNKETREMSRTRLLTYLGTCQDNYKSAKLEELGKRTDAFLTQEQALNQEITDKEQKIKEREAEFQKEVEAIQQQKARDLRITVQTTRQELEEVNQEQLRQSQAAYNQSLNQINSACQSNLSQIRNSFNNVQVGEPVCRYGHDNNIQVYNKSGDREFAEQARERTRRMEEAIREQERQKQDMINQIMQARNKRETAFRRELDLRRENDELLLKQQQLEREINLKKQRQDLEDQINSSASSRETNLRNQSNQQVQE
ncbi:15207_t:CDS:2 [Entrophospora sp. SA101]|nr:15207_t:CDS:2 [Entrophospora sp. SA101]